VASWTVRQVGRLLKLAETDVLSGDELRRARAVAPLAPGRGDWLLAAERLCAFASALLLTAALVFFFAYNWAELHRFAKLGIGLGALAACVVAALFSRPQSTLWRAALFAAAIATGALLALIGQIYQTGADVWELFFAWMMLMLPFVVLARFTGSWMLWLLVANAALVRGMAVSAWSGFFGSLFEPQSLFLISALNLAVLMGFEAGSAHLLLYPRRHLQRLAAAGMLAPLVLGAILGCWDSDMLPVTLVFLPVAAATAWVYYHWRRDLPILAITAAALIAVLTSALARIMPGGAEFITANLMALFVIGSSAAAAAWLARLYRQDHVR
jgi:uncharacterized membrane protein